jgi:hypothetical protein
MHSVANVDDAINRLATTPRNVAVIDLRISRSSHFKVALGALDSTVGARPGSVVTLLAEPWTLARTRFHDGGSLSRLMESGASMP